VCHALLSVCFETNLIKSQGGSFSLLISAKFTTVTSLQSLLRSREHIYSLAGLGGRCERDNNTPWLMLALVWTLGCFSSVVCFCFRVWQPTILFSTASRRLQEGDTTAKSWRRKTIAIASVTGRDCKLENTTASQEILPGACLDGGVNRVNGANLSLIYP
jgi:hypothetical protein